MSTINTEVREHQQEIPWQYRDVCQLSWHYFDRLRTLAFPEMPDCYLCCQPLPRGQQIDFLPGDNAVGAQYQLTLNPRALEIPRYQLAALILHGMVHMWQERVGRPGATGYHNRAFTRRSEDLGIPCQSGRHCAVVGWENPFREWIIEADADAYQPVPVSVPSAAGSTCRQKKWACGCHSVRAAGDLDYQCRRCGQLVVKQE